MAFAQPVSMVNAPEGMVAVKKRKRADDEENFANMRSEAGPKKPTTSSLPPLP